MFSILLSRNADKEFRSLEEKYRKRVENILKVLFIDPVPIRLCDVRKLKNLKNTFRIRLGKLRIVYIINWKEKQILIARISFRKVAYD